MQIAIPTSEGGILLWSQVICLWILSSYVFGNDPIGKTAIESRAIGLHKRISPNIGIRAIVSAVLTFFLPGLNFTPFGGRILLALLIALFSILLPLIRNSLALSRTEVLNRLLAEWEVFANLILVMSVGCIVARASLQISTEDVLVTLPLSSRELTISIITIAGGLFIFDGGTQITRGILVKTGTAPKTFAKENVVTGGTDTQKTPSGLVDSTEYKRGQYIGNLERLLVFAVVLVGSYEAIGFIIAGKGLIRAKEFESRDFAEYFLIGTLSSTMVAVGVGLLIKFAINNITNGAGAGSP